MDDEAIVSKGPSWQIVATGLATIMFSAGLGAGGYFIAQQATRDNRQDQLLDATAQKLVDAALTLVAVQQGVTVAQKTAEEAKSMVSREVTLREERDRQELDEYRRRAVTPPQGARSK